MNEEQLDHLGFREWTSHYEKEQEADRIKANKLQEVVSNLSTNVGALTADVRTLVENQKSLFNRQNRPWQWGVVVAGFMAMFSMSGMFGVMASLIVTPIQDSIEHQSAVHAKDLLALSDVHARDVERNLELHMWMKTTLTEVQIADAKADTDIKWLMKLEDRYNSRIHKVMTGRPDMKEMLNQYSADLEE